VLEKYANKFNKGIDDILGGTFGGGSSGGGGGGAAGAAEEGPQAPRSVSALRDSGAQTNSIDQDGEQDEENSGKSVNVAAAVGVNVVFHDSRATTADGVDLSANSDVAVGATNDANYHAEGTGATVFSDIGIGVGVGVTNTVNVTEAKLGADNTVTGAENVTVKAESKQNQSDDFRNKLTSEGSAGAGAGEIGVAGALAVTNTVNNTRALVGQGTRIGTLDDRITRLSVESIDTSKIAAKAWAGALQVEIPSGSDDGENGGKKGAVGATFVVLNSVNTNRAEVGKDAAVFATEDVGVVAINARPTDAKFDFDGDFDLLNPLAFLQTSSYYTESLAGAGATGDLVLAGSFAVTVSHNTTEALIGKDAVVDAEAVTVEAENRQNARSLAGGLGAAQKLGIGASLTA